MFAALKTCAFTLFKSTQDDYVSDWCMYEDIIKCEKLKPGSLIEFSRTGILYQHWGVYVGKGLLDSRYPVSDMENIKNEHELEERRCNDHVVIHFGRNKESTNKEQNKFNSNISLKNKLLIASGSLEDVAEKSKCRVNNSFDKYARPYSVKRIIMNAEFMMKDITNDQGVLNTYSLFNSNCEHFAHWCRYGICNSVQAERFTKPYLSLFQSGKNKSTKIRFKEHHLKSCDRCSWSNTWDEIFKEMNLSIKGIYGQNPYDENDWRWTYVDKSRDFDTILFMHQLFISLEAWKMFFEGRKQFPIPKTCKIIVETKEGPIETTVFKHISVAFMATIEMAEKAGIFKNLNI